MSDNKILAIIPARGGSVRIPNKNIVPFGGKPLIAWTIEAALESGRFTDVLVSTESESIAEVAVRYGASVPFLREESFDGIASASQATLAALKQYENKITTENTMVVQLMATCPLRSAEEICDFIEHFVETDAPAQISCSLLSGGGAWWSCILNEYGEPKYLFEEMVSKRSQDLPLTYVPTGAIWACKKKNFYEEKTFYVKGHTFLPVTWLAAIDIDTPEDLAIAEKLL